MSFHINITDTQDAVILHLNGRFVLGTPTNDFREIIEKQFEASRRNIILDMQDVAYIDSSGLGEIVFAGTSAAREGGAMKLLHMNRKTVNLMQLVKLHTVFDSYTDERSALASFSELRQMTPAHAV
jgi:anti-sigma B factor antagonist